jgi:hypothetical protein
MDNVLVESEEVTQPDLDQEPDWEWISDVTGGR